MTFDILTFVAIIAAFFVFAGYAYSVGYRNGYRRAMTPVGMGTYSQQYIPPDYEDGSPMP